MAAENLTRDAGAIAVALGLLTHVARNSDDYGATHECALVDALQALARLCAAAKGQPIYDL